MKSYADEGFLAESAQPFFSNLRMVPPETPAGANLFLGELEFERNVVQKPSIAPEMHNTSRQLHERRESVNEKKEIPKNLPLHPIPLPARWRLLPLCASPLGEPPASPRPSPGGIRVPLPCSR